MAMTKIPNNDLKYMKMAFNLAQRAKGRTSPNPLVGCVIVRAGKVIASGWHKRCGGDHAEIMALKSADPARVKGASLYVTLEPCSHFGRTPPCVDQIIKRGIKEVIVGMKDPNPVNNGKSLLKFKKAGIQVRIGFLEDELKQMNESFIKYITQRLPFVVAKCGQTLDGKIATSQGQSRWITSKESRDYAHRLRNDFDGILVGIRTVLNDDPFLNTTAKIRKNINPIKKIIIDSRLRLPPAANLFKNTAPSRIIVATTRLASQSKIRQWMRRGIMVLVCPQKRNQVEWRWLLKELAKQEITNVLIEGGGQTIGGALRAGMVDKMIIFLAPKIMGDESAISSVAGSRIKHVDQSVRLRDLTIKKFKEDILIEGYVYRNH